MPAAMSAGHGQRLSVSLDVRPERPQAGAQVRWEIRLANDGPERVGLTFATAQLGDVVLLQEGSERWRWSEGRMFAQVISERELAPGEAWSFSLEGALDVEPGSYDAVASVRSDPAAPPARRPVVVDAKR